MTLERQRHFEEIMAALPRRLRDLLAASPLPRSGHPAIPRAAGIYCFSENGRPVYIGQTRNLQSRLRQHTSAYSTQESASFAYLLAVEDAKRQGISTTDTRKKLVVRPDFAPLFSATKARVANMDVRFIVMPDPVERTVFEVYAALHLGTERYNSFETH